MATLQQLEEGIRRAHAAGNAEHVKLLGAEYRRLQAEKQAPGTPMPAGMLGTQVAFADQAIDAIPIAGPWLKDQLSNARAGIAGGLEALSGATGIGGYKAPTKEQLDQFSSQQVADNPVAALGGQVFGTAAPFALGGAIPGVARMIGATGGTLSQSVAGGLSSAGIMGTDRYIRTGDTQDAITTGLTAGALGALAPVIGAVGGKAISAITGKGVPKDIRNIARAMADDGIDPKAANAQLAQMGPDSMLMDLGPNLQRQAGALAGLPGKAQKTIRSAIEKRAAGNPARVQSDIEATLGMGPEIGALAEQIVKAQSAAATPLYAAVRDVAVEPKGNILFVLQTPMGKSAFAQAVKMAANDGVPSNGLTIGLIDYAKRALDDITKEALRAGRGNESRQAANMARLLASEADKVAPGYKAAREAFAGPAQVLDAIKEGQGVFGKEMSPAHLKTMLSEMTASEREAFLHSARNAVEASMGNAVNDALALRNMFKKGWNEAKLRMLLGDDVADDLLRRIERQATFGQSANVVAGNSETLARTAASEEVAPAGSRLAGGDVTLFGMVLKAFNAAIATAKGKGQARTNPRMANTLAANQITPQQIAQIIDASRRRGQFAPGAIVAPMLSGPEPLVPDIIVRGGGS